MESHSLQTSGSVLCIILLSSIDNELSGCLLVVSYLKKSVVFDTNDQLVYRAAYSFMSFGFWKNLGDIVPGRGSTYTCHPGLYLDVINPAMRK